MLLAELRDIRLLKKIHQLSETPLVAADQFAIRTL